MAVKDHLGNEFKSIRAMAIVYGLSGNVVSKRLRAGWNLERALSNEDMRTRGNRTTYVVCHKGIKHTNFRTLCDHYGVKYTTFYSRKKKGMTLEQCVFSGQNNTMSKRVCRGIAVYDHKGIGYVSKTEMCLAWGFTDASLVASRLKGGMTLREALETPVRRYMTKIICTAGIEHASVAKFARYYGIIGREDIRRAVDMLAMGKSVEEVIRIIPKTICPKGVEYGTEREMCEAYGVKPYVYWGRRKKSGWRLCEALELSGRGIDKRIQRGEQINEKLYINDGLYWINASGARCYQKLVCDKRELRHVYTGMDGRKYYRVTVKATGEVLYRNSDQILAYGKDGEV
jgi:hypothetical protein